MEQKHTQKLFSMRMHNAEGDRFLAALDDLRLAERPQLTRTDMVKRLVFEAERKLLQHRRKSDMAIRTDTRGSGTGIDDAS